MTNDFGYYHTKHVTLRLMSNLHLINQLYFLAAGPCKSLSHWPPAHLSTYLLTLRYRGLLLLPLTACAMSALPSLLHLKGEMECNGFPFQSGATDDDTVAHCTRHIICMQAVITPLG